jgi:hypothetical protein
LVAEIAAIPAWKQEQLSEISQAAPAVLARLGRGAK